MGKRYAICECSQTEWTWQQLSQERHNGSPRALSLGPTATQRLNKLCTMDYANPTVNYAREAPEGSIIVAISWGAMDWSFGSRAFWTLRECIYKFLDSCWLLKPTGTKKQMSNSSSSIRSTTCFSHNNTYPLFYLCRSSSDIPKIAGGCTETS